MKRDSAPQGQSPAADCQIFCRIVCSSALRRLPKSAHRPSPRIGCTSSSSCVLCAAWDKLSASLRDCCENAGSRAALCHLYEYDSSDCACGRPLVLSCRPTLMDPFVQRKRHREYCLWEPGGTTEHAIRCLPPTCRRRSDGLSRGAGGLARNWGSFAYSVQKLQACRWPPNSSGPSPSAHQIFCKVCLHHNLDCLLEHRY